MNLNDTEDFKTENFEYVREAENSVVPVIKRREGKWTKIDFVRLHPADKFEKANDHVQYFWQGENSVVGTCSFREYKSKQEATLAQVFVEEKDYLSSNAKRFNIPFSEIEEIIILEERLEKEMPNYRIRDLS